MDAIEISEFLQSQQTGVLSMANDDDSYAIPVSFTYVEDDEHSPAVYLRLGYGPNSLKRRFVDATDYVSFVVYDSTADGWKSVVARGPIGEQSEPGLGASITESVRGLNIPFFRVFDSPASDLEFSVVRIDVEELDGIVAPAE